ncbi:hypothetical protein CKA32_000632 [Geitlerinema sp. FC II]|nr:hypothetical protein CKA32_000632 [Geitlerinema sp. FC II]
MFGNKKLKDTSINSSLLRNKLYYRESRTRFKGFQPLDWKPE